tara:strand:- start:353 stop:550 length:198 start_codon:yes stop_codon:yes gene_type:complete
MIAFLYLGCLFALGGAAFALMYYNLKSIYWGARPRKHPEAPELGEEVMYVDLTRERLEQLYEEDK